MTTDELVELFQDLANDVHRLADAAERIADKPDGWERPPEVPPEPMP
jgi:hypothetical protein